MGKRLREASEIFNLEEACKKEMKLSGKGLNDCICGQSKKMPRCDGSHNKL